MRKFQAVLISQSRHLSVRPKSLYLRINQGLNCCHKSSDQIPKFKGICNFLYILALFIFYDTFNANALYSKSLSIMCLTHVGKRLLTKRVLRECFAQKVSFFKNCNILLVVQALNICFVSFQNGRIMTEKIQLRVSSRICKYMLAILNFQYTG